MKTSDFDYSLPKELIAQTPIEPRDHSRLMVINRDAGSIEHRQFFEITDYLGDGDVLVCNDSRVIPARLRGRKVDGGGVVEILLLRRRDSNVWEALAKPAKRIRAGSKVEIMNDLAPVNGGAASVVAEVIAEGEAGIKVLSFSDESRLPAVGEIPLPPYIHSPLADPERYQTVYATADGSVAAPTAGLHFTPALLDGIRRKGVRCLFVTLHIGLDTFRPVTEDDPLKHNIYREYGRLDGEVAEQLSIAKREGRRIICVGTTATRLVEQVAALSYPLQPFEGWVSLFILPGYRFRMVGGLVTNFHLPRSTLLMLVTAFAGAGLVSKAYQEAITRRYRLYSFGDAMLVL